MTLTRYIILMLAATILCWVAWFLVVVYLDPDTAGWLGFGFFYLALFLSLVGSFALLGLGFRLYILRNELIFEQVSVSFRQALSFGALVIASLFLESKDLFTWWNELLLVLVLTFIEFAILILKRREPPL